MEGLEKERDFYFGKLRDIEVQCQEEEDAPAGSVIDKIKAILYATEVSAGGLSLCNHLCLATKSCRDKKWWNTSLSVVYECFKTTKCKSDSSKNSWVTEGKLNFASCHQTKKLFPQNLTMYCLRKNILTPLTQGVWVWTTPPPPQSFKKLLFNAQPLPSEFSMIILKIRPQGAHSLAE